jgi:hypothetical protein
MLASSLHLMTETGKAFENLFCIQLYLLLLVAGFSRPRPGFAVRTVYIGILGGPSGT